MGYLAQADTVHMSVVVLGELVAGFKSGSEEKRNKELLERFLLKPTVSVLEATMETAEIFGFIMASLRKSGTPIPINAVWIAAHCLETGSLLITYDTHFAQIPGLRVWDEAGH